MAFTKLVIPGRSSGAAARWQRHVHKKKDGEGENASLYLLIRTDRLREAKIGPGSRVELFIGLDEDAGRIRVVESSSDLARRLTKQGGSHKISLPHRGDLAEQVPAFTGTVPVEVYETGEQWLVIGLPVDVPDAQKVEDDGLEHPDD